MSGELRKESSGFTVIPNDVLELTQKYKLDTLLNYIKQYYILMTGELELGDDSWDAEMREEYQNKINALNTVIETLPPEEPEFEKAANQS